MDRIEDRLIVRITQFALTVLILTSVHHVYGAYRYQTPWRLHAAAVSAVVAAVIVACLFTIRRRRDDTRAYVAFWVLVVVTALVPVLAIGVFEGGYNHVLKNVLYFAGAPRGLMTALFPPPLYEMPDDLFFEATGVMQVIPGFATGWFLYELLRERWRRSDIVRYA